MNFYQSVFAEKNFFENICKNGGFGNNYPLIFTLSGQSLAFKFFFSNLEVPHICGVVKKSKTFNILVFFTVNMTRPPQI